MAILNERWEDSFVQRLITHYSQLKGSQWQPSSSLTAHSSQLKPLSSLVCRTVGPFFRLFFYISPHGRYHHRMPCSTLRIPVPILHYRTVKDAPLQRSQGNPKRFRCGADAKRRGICRTHARSSSRSGLHRRMGSDLRR